MSILARAVAAYLVLVGAAVAVNFVLTPVYHPGGDEPFTLWEILNWFMAAAIVLTLVSSYAYKRRIDNDESADVKRFIEANTVFHVTVVVFLLFFWNWFSNLSPNNEPDGQVWTIVDTVMPIVTAVTLAFACGAARPGSQVG